MKIEIRNVSKLYSLIYLFILFIHAMFKEATITILPLGPLKI